MYCYIHAGQSIINQHHCMRGFPCAEYSFIEDNLSADDNGGGIAGGVSGFFESDPHFRGSGIAFNGFVMLVVVAAVGFASESLLRRREARTDLLRGNVGRINGQRWSEPTRSASRD